VRDIRVLEALIEHETQDEVRELLLWEYHLHPAARKLGQRNMNSEDYRRFYKKDFD